LNKDIIPCVQRARNNETPEEQFRFDRDVYAELSIEDDRNAETIAYELGWKSKTPTLRSFERLEALNVLRLDPRPNGRRTNCRYRKMKLTGNDRLKVIDLYNAPHYESWNKKTRLQLIDRYFRIGWNVMPLRLDRHPIMDEDEWRMLSKEDKLDMFSDQVFGVGLWIDQQIVFTFRQSNEAPTFETLTAKSADGYQCFFWRTPETRYIYSLDRVVHNVSVHTKGSFVVLPPTPGYEWSGLVRPSHLFYYPQLLQTFEYAMMNRIDDSNVNHGKYVLPDFIFDPYQEPHLFRYGRSLRARGATLEQITDELTLANGTVCHPPLDDDSLAKVIKRVWELEDKPNFVAACGKQKKS
jgi:hypothetical protein